MADIITVLVTRTVSMNRGLEICASRYQMKNSTLLRLVPEICQLNATLSTLIGENCTAKCRSLESAWRDILVKCHTA